MAYTNPPEVLKHKLRVLIVDDIQDNRMKMLLNLKKLKVEVLQAENGQEAIDILLNEKNIHLVIMDNDMPIMNGIQATKALRDAGVTTTIVGLGDSVNADIKKAFIEAGADEYLEKPMPRYNIGQILIGIDRKM